MDERGATVHGPPKMWLTMLDQGRPIHTIELPDTTFVIGRDEACDLVLHDQKVSRRHVAILPGAGRLRLVQDLGSSNGTLVNGRPVTGGLGFHTDAERVAELEGGEVIQVGDTQLVATLADPRTFTPPPS